MFRLISKTLFFLFLSITIPTLSHARALQQTTTLEEEIIRESMLTPDKMPNEISSHEGIRTRLLIGMPVYFPKEWEEKERKIEPNWIIEALTETAVKLENLPSRIEFPNNLKDKIRYDPSRKLLILKWVISEKEKEDILELSEDTLFRNAIESLFQNSRTKKIHIINAIITGDLDLRKGAKFCSIEESGLERKVIERLKTLGAMNVHMVYTDISIESSRLEGNLLAGKELRPVHGYKESVVFQKRVSFSDTFLGKACFGGTTFLDAASFEWVTFNGQVSFIDTTFEKLARFKAIFKQKAIFNKSNFHGEASFCESTFEGEAYFSGAYFKKCSFGMVEFQNIAYFNEATFHGIASFTGAIFKEAVFYKTTFTGDVDLSGADYLKLHISWQQLEGRLDSPLYSEYGLLTLLKKDKKWQMEKKNRKSLGYWRFIEWQEVYLRLIKNFNDIGDTDSADDAYYDYHRVKPKFDKVGMDSEEDIVGRGFWEKTIEWREYIFLGLTCGYGVKPSRALGAEGILIIVATFVFFLRKGSLEYQQEGGRCLRQCFKRFGNCFYLSAMLAITVGFGSLHPKGLLGKVVAIVVGFFGWMFMSLFLISLSRVWLR